MLLGTLSRRVVRSALWAIILDLAPCHAHATTPNLSRLPQPPSPSACHGWAAAQSQDGLTMWGIMDVGDSSRGVAMTRLTSYCMGSGTPEIVDFGSSVGASNAYCGKHSETPLCERYLVGQGTAGGQAIALRSASPGAKAAKCTVFHDNGQISQSGFIVKYPEQTEVDDKSHVATGLRLDRPICFDKNLDQFIDLLTITAVADTYLGRHVRVQLKMVAGEAWSAEVLKIKMDPNLP